jgi:hypothetical protein
VVDVAPNVSTMFFSFCQLLEQVPIDKRLRLA